MSFGEPSVLHFDSFVSIKKRCLLASLFDTPKRTYHEPRFGDLRHFVLLLNDNSIPTVGQATLALPIISSEEVLKS